MSYADAVAVAVNKVRKEIPDTLAQTNYLWKLMMDRKEYVSGGLQIQMPLAIIENVSNGFINGFSTPIDINPAQNFVPGLLDWKYFYQNYTLTLQDWTITNDTETAVISLIKAKAALCKNSAVRTLSQATYLTGTSANNRFNGMADIFAASGTAYAGVLDTTYPSWLPAIDSTTTVINYTNISNMIATLSERVDQAPVDPILMTDYQLDYMISRARVQSAFKATLQTQQRFMDQDKLKAGFKGIEVDGLFWQTDYYCPGTQNTADNYLFVLSSNSFHFFNKYGFGGKDSPMDTHQVIPNQPLDINVSYMAGNMGCSNRRVNGVFTTLTAAGQ